MFVVDLALSSMYADLYDRGCNTLNAVLKSALGGSNGKNVRTRGCGKSWGFAKGRNLFVLGITCVLGIGEARWLGDTNDGQVVNSVNEGFEGVSIDVCRLVSTIHTSSYRHSTNKLLYFVFIYLAD